MVMRGRAKFAPKSVTANKQQQQAFVACDPASTLQGETCDRFLGWGGVVDGSEM